MAWCRSWGTIILLRERAELSRTIISKIEHIEHIEQIEHIEHIEHIERVLKNIGTIVKRKNWNEWKLLKKNVKIRNAFLSPGMRSKSHFKS